jgi:hypothetical protein
MIANFNRNMKFTDKMLVLRRLVTKIVAKQEVIIWDQISILATIQVAYEFINRHS